MAFTARCVVGRTHGMQEFDSTGDADARRFQRVRMAWRALLPRRVLGGSYGLNKSLNGCSSCIAVCNESTARRFCELGKQVITTYFPSGSLANDHRCRQIIQERLLAPARGFQTPRAVPPRAKGNYKGQETSGNSTGLVQPTVALRLRARCALRSKLPLGLGRVVGV